MEGFVISHFGVFEWKVLHSAQDEDDLSNIKLENRSDRDVNETIRLKEDSSKNSFLKSILIKFSGRP